MPTSRRVRPLSGDDGLSHLEFGFKAARLGEMLRLGLSVPDGCAISVATLEEFCAVNGIDRAGTHPERVAERIRQGVMPTGLMDELDRWLETRPDERYAVRSSAVAEDGAACSMAGQLETLLDVAAPGIVTAIKRCWAAMFGAAAMAYSAKHRMPHTARMGVVIQRQVDARYSGVLFTLDPVSRSADHFVVEWVEGAGDALVSGRVTPERVLLSRHRAVIPGSLPAPLRSGVARLVESAHAVERHLACPVDLEWCVNEEGLHLLQARPITAVTTPTSVVWTCTNMSENFPRPLTPFAWSVVDEFYVRYIRTLARTLGVRDAELDVRGGDLHRLTGVQRGRVYYNIKSWYRLLDRHVPGLGGTFRQFLDGYIGQRVPIPMDVTVSRARPLSATSFWGRLVWHLARARRRLPRFERLFLNYRRDMRRRPYESLALGGLVRKLDGLLEEFVERHWHHQGIADFSVLVFPGALEAAVRRWLPHMGDPTELTARLVSGVEVRSTDSVALIRRIARQIAEHDILQRWLQSRDYAVLEHALPCAIRDLFDEFMERFGGRCYHESMIASPTFEERTDLFWELVAKYQRAGPAVDGDRGDAPAEDDAAAALAGCLSGLPAWKRCAFRWLVKRARTAIALREQGRLVQSLLFGEVRRLALAIGRRLVEKGHLRDGDDVFYLHPGEIRDLCYGKLLLPETLHDLVSVRRAALARCETVEPPECFVLEEGDPFELVHRSDHETGGGDFRGIGASCGVVEGTARVVLDPVLDNRLQPGDVLIARSTDPGWTPLFAIAGGLVLERGGMLSHGAIVAREFGIPAVLGVEGATTRIHDGDRLRVDGRTGNVLLLERARAIDVVEGTRRRCRA